MQLTELYHQMARSRAVELAVEKLWNEGLVSGEMHLGTGEEAVAAGVVTHLRAGDGLALTHRCSPALVIRGVPLVPFLRELMGRPDGLCGGHGGHMHVMAKEQLAATSGIVGASLPLGAGFALAAKRLRRGAIGLSFIGDGALNQGMALETLNLACTWSLPHVVVCIDNGWAITTPAGSVTAGDLLGRARAFGWHAEQADGTDVVDVHRVAGALVDRARKGHGPAFLYAKCPRLDGHFLGDPLLRQVHDPMGAETQLTMSSVLGGASAAGGGGLLARAGSMLSMVGVMAKARFDATRDGPGDPMQIARKAMAKHAADRERVDGEVAREVAAAVSAALEEGGGRG